MRTNSQTNIIEFHEEEKDTIQLIDTILKDKWVDEDTIIVNCLLQYSSRLTQSLSHGLSPLNNGEPMDVMNMNIPLPGMSQVPDLRVPFTWILFDTYLKEWAWTYANKQFKYLFNCAVANDDMKFAKIKMAMHQRGCEDFRFSALYVAEGTQVKPDYFVKEYKGTPKFMWENYKIKIYE